METINEFKDKAKVAYLKFAQAKEALEEVFGKKTFLNIMDRVQSFEDACQETGRDPKDPYFSACRPHENAIRKWEVVCEALNEGVVLSYANGRQEKWHVYLIYEGSCFRFHVVAYTLTHSYTGLGSRLGLCSEKLARHAAKYFLPLIIETVS